MHHNLPYPIIKSPTFSRLHSRQQISNSLRFPSVTKSMQIQKLRNCTVRSFCIRCKVGNRNRFRFPERYVAAGVFLRSVRFRLRVRSGDPPRPPLPAIALLIGATMARLFRVGD